MQQLDKRWDARQTGLEPLTVTASVLIDRPPAEIWAFLSNPRSALLLNPDVIKTFHVPGTPKGEVGHQQCVITNVAGRLSAHLTEVVALEEPHRQVTRWPTMATEMLSTLTLSPEDSHTKVTYQLGLRVEAGTSKKKEPRLRADLEDHLQRMRACVHAGAHFAEHDD